MIEKLFYTVQQGGNAFKNNIFSILNSFKIKFMDHPFILKVQDHCNDLVYHMTLEFRHGIFSY